LRPQELFAIQLGFAKKWSELEKIPLNVALRTKTALYKELLGEGSHSDWEEIIKALEPLSIDQASSWLFDLQKSGLVTPQKTPKNFSRFFGPLRYIYFKERKEFTIHLTIQDELAAISLFREGKNFVKELLQDVKNRHPEAQFGVLETSMLSKSFWKHVMPFDKIIQESRGIEKDDPLLMSDAIWSQFIDFKGRPKVRVIDKFLENLREAKTVQDLLDAFPRRPKIYRGDLAFYYEYYRVT